MADMPKVWSTLLATYVLLERQTNFENSLGPTRTLPAEHRPMELQWWISRGRSKPPILADIDIDVYVPSWWNWWIGMQPEWRLPANTTDPAMLDYQHRMFPLDVSQAPHAWHDLDQPGQNGFLSIVASMGWWAAAIKLKYPSQVSWHRELDEGQNWAQAAADVIWVMQRLVASRTTVSPDTNVAA